MSSRRARWGAVAVAAVFVLMGATNAHAQDTPTTTDTTAKPTTTTTTTITTEPAPTTVTSPPAPPTSTTTVTIPANPAAPTTVTTVMTNEPVNRNPAQVMVPPQEKGPMTVGNFNAAVNNQRDNLARLRRLTSLTAQNITLIPVSQLSPSSATAGIEQAVERAGSRSATSAREAASNNSAISAALSAANVSADNVLAIAVRGHNLNDVTVYHR